ncbi:hypothetical protein AN2V17_11750 [Vallitalea sp. AN17-2]|uniref:Uncharacterized protein n=2 Tax=Vallitalea maricola TaxID=3074433 RepID=A0ACB5UH67_9FIRM|nr:hypothetical protein AN2V17_11750 [Vallitalea sp. AN17-2]
MIIHQLFGDFVIQENGFYNFKPMITGVFIGGGIMLTGGFFEAFRKDVN